MCDVNMENIPVVIFCGGQGTRMQGSTRTKKELVEVGGQPILWHVMRIFSAFGHNRFVLTLGYEAAQIKRYFLDYEAMSRDFTLQLGGAWQQPHVAFHSGVAHLPWTVSLIDTGLHTEKASRLKCVEGYVEADRFFLTYGDGVGDVDLDALVKFHKAHGKLVTVTGVHAPFQYGTLEIDGQNRVVGYEQKPILPYWINAGFMLIERPVLDMIAGGGDVHLEREIFPLLVERGELMVFKHTGFWRSMDTLKDAMVLDGLWRESAPWKVW